jgi:hypothetical protein
MLRDDCFPVSKRRMSSLGPSFWDGMAVSSVKNKNKNSFLYIKYSPAMLLLFWWLDVSWWTHTTGAFFKTRCATSPCQGDLMNANVHDPLALLQVEPTIALGCDLAFPIPATPAPLSSRTACLLSGTNPCNSEK